MENIIQDINNMLNQAWLERDVAERREVAALKQLVDEKSHENEALRHQLAITLTSGVARIYK